MGRKPNVCNLAFKYLKVFPGGIVWRFRRHCEVAQNHLNPGESVRFVFLGQKNERFYDIFQTCAVVITNKRLLIAQKRVVWGYFLTSITPDLYNDLKVYRGLIWGKVTIDTIKEVVVISNLSKRALPTIETEVTQFMMEAKKKYGRSLGK